MTGPRRHGADRRPLDPVSSDTLRRFFMMVTLIVSIGVFASRDPLAAIAGLALFNAVVVALIAAVRREPFFGSTLARWDEALGYVALALGAGALG